MYVYFVYAEYFVYLFFFGAVGLMQARPKGAHTQSERRADGVRKKRCAIPLTRSKELFQPDARSDFLLLGPGLRPGRCGRVGSPEGSRAERVQWTKQRRHGWRCAPVFASARRGAPQKAAKRERTKGGVETPSLPLWPSGAPTPTKKRPFPGALCVCIIFVKMNFEKIRFLPFRAGSGLPGKRKAPACAGAFPLWGKWDDRINKMPGVVTSRCGSRRGCSSASSSCQRTYPRCRIRPPSPAPAWPWRGRRSIRRCRRGGGPR